MLPENRHVIRFLGRRAALNRHRKAVCYWAVIHDEFARQVAIELHDGCRADAVILLCTLAKDIGPIYPAETSDSDLSFDTA